MERLKMVCVRAIIRCYITMAICDVLALKGRENTATVSNSRRPIYGYLNPRNSISSSSAVQNQRVTYHHSTSLDLFHTINITLRYSEESGAIDVLISARVLQDQYTALGPAAVLPIEFPSKTKKVIRDLGHVRNESPKWPA